MEHVALGARTMVAFVFAISAASKLHDRAAYAGFFAALRRTQLGTQPCDPAVAISLVTAGVCVPSTAAAGQW